MEDEIEVRDIPSVTPLLWRERRLSLLGRVARVVAACDYGVGHNWRVRVQVPELNDSIEEARTMHALLGRAIQEAERLREEVGGG